MKRIFNKKPLSGNRAKLFKRLMAAGMRQDHAISPSIEPDRPQKPGGRYVGNHELTDIFFARSCLKDSGTSVRHVFLNALKRKQKQFVAIEYLVHIYEWIEAQIKYLEKNLDLIEIHIDDELSRERAYEIAVSMLMSRSLTSSKLADMQKCFRDDPVSGQELNFTLNSTFAYLDIIQSGVWKGIKHKSKLNTEQFLQMFREHCSAVVKKFAKEFDPASGHLDVECFAKEESRGKDFIAGLVRSETDQHIKIPSTRRLQSRIDKVDPLDIEMLSFLINRGTTWSTRRRRLRYIRAYKDQLISYASEDNEWSRALFSSMSYIKEILPFLLNDRDLDVALFLIEGGMAFHAARHSDIVWGPVVFNEMYGYIADRYQETLRLDEDRLERIREGQILKVIARCGSSTTVHIDNLNRLLKLDVRAAFAYIEGLRESQYASLMRLIKRIKFDFTLNPDNEAIQPYLLLKDCSYYHRAEDFVISLISENDAGEVTEKSVAQYKEGDRANSRWIRELDKSALKLKGRREEKYACRKRQFDLFRKESEDRLGAVLHNPSESLIKHIPSKAVTKWARIFQQGNSYESVYAGMCLHQLVNVLNQKKRGDVNQSNKTMFFSQLLEICRLQLATLLEEGRLNEAKIGITVALMKKVDTSYPNLLNKADDEYEEGTDSIVDLKIDSIEVDYSSLSHYVDSMGRGDLLSISEQQLYYDREVRAIVAGAFCSMAVGAISGVGVGLAVTGVVTGIIATAIPIVAAVLVGVALLAWMIAVVVQKAKESSHIKKKKTKLLDVIKNLTNNKGGALEAEDNHRIRIASGSSIFAVKIPAEDVSVSEKRLDLSCEGVRISCCARD